MEGIYNYRGNILSNCDIGCQVPTSLAVTDCCRLVYPFAESIMSEILTGNNKPVLFCILTAFFTNLLAYQTFHSQSLLTENTSNNSLYLYWVRDDD